MSESKLTPTTKAPRTFKTEWFAKAAKKAGIGDDELCKAIKQMIIGQADDLGGGVFKKRLNKNRHRCIILGKDGKCWVYAYLYAKKDRQNIDEPELKAFRELADLYAQRSESDVEKELKSKALLEICR
jgi:hypothetical protein